MNLIITPSNAAIYGHDYTNASATIKIKERQGSTKVTIKVSGAKPNHLHTVWYKLVLSGSPITGIGATPAAPTTQIDNLMMDAGTHVARANAFYTNPAGNGTLKVDLNFPLSAGVYPFSQYNSDLPDISTSNSPFTFRVISHGTDNVQHGLVPCLHEPTFQISL